MSFTIRPAQKKDALTVAPLIYMAIEDLAEQFTGARNKVEAIKRLALVFTYTRNRFSYQYAHVLEENNTVVAVASAYSESIIDDLTNTTLSLSKKLQWQIDGNILTRLKEDKEAPIGSYYIDHISVNPIARGKGYASKLIETLEALAIKSRHDKIALLADLNNPNAKKLYEKLGYLPVSTVRANGHIYTALIKNLNVKPSN